MLVDHLKEDIFRYNSSMTRVICKLSLFTILVFTFFLVTLPSLIMYFIHQKTGRYILAKIVSLHSRICLKIFNIDLSIIGKSNIDKNGALLVSNHMSYVDILCLASIYHTQFVTSLEMKETPFLGHIAQAAGCVFVDRKSKNKREKELRDLVETLSSGGLVTIFPEATSTNGDDVLKFRHGLFESCFLAKRDVNPITINYKFINNEKVSIHNRDLICWYGDMTFFTHFFKLLSIKSIHVEIIFHEKLRHENFTNKSDLANRSHEIVKDKFLQLS